MNHQSKTLLHSASAKALLESNSQMTPNFLALTCTKIQATLFVNDNVNETCTIGPFVNYFINPHQAPIGWN
jgi:hypothetical protein